MVRSQVVPPVEGRRPPRIRKQSPHHHLALFVAQRSLFSVRQWDAQVSIYTLQHVMDSHCVVAGVLYVDRSPRLGEGATRDDDKTDVSIDDRSSERDELVFPIRVGGSSVDGEVFGILPHIPV